MTPEYFRKWLRRFFRSIIKEEMEKYIVPTINIKIDQPENVKNPISVQFHSCCLGQIEINDISKKKRPIDVIPYADYDQDQMK